AFGGGDGNHKFPGGDVERRVVIGDQHGIDAVQLLDEPAEMAGIVSGDADMTAKAARFRFAEELNHGRVRKIKIAFAVKKFVWADAGAIPPPVVPIRLVNLQQVHRIASQQPEIFPQLHVQGFDRAEMFCFFEVADLGRQKMFLGLVCERFAKNDLRRPRLVKNRCVEIANAESEGAANGLDGTIESGESWKVSTERQARAGLAAFAERSLREERHKRS